MVSEPSGKFLELSHFLRRNPGNQNIRFAPTQALIMAAISLALFPWPIITPETLAQGAMVVDLAKPRSS
jgi:hypothetical protein